MAEKMTATNAVRIVFPQLPHEFYGLDLIRRVRTLTDRPFMYDETPLRKMRLLFHGEYELIDKLHSKYRKTGGNGSGYTRSDRERPEPSANNSGGGVPSPNGSGVATTVPATLFGEAT